MKSKQLACLVLLVAIGIFGYGTQKMYNKMQSKRTEAEENRVAAESAEREYETATITLTALKAKTQNIRDFYNEWLPYLKSTRSPQATEQRIVDLIKNSEVFAASVKFELLERRDAPLFKKVLRGNIVLEDEYSKVFNWLGILEESLPSARIANLRLVKGDTGDDLKLELTVDVPIIDEKAT